MKKMLISKIVFSCLVAVNVITFIQKSDLTSQTHTLSLQQQKISDKIKLLKNLKPSFEKTVEHVSLLNLDKTMKAIRDTCETLKLDNAHYQIEKQSCHHRLEAHRIKNILITLRGSVGSDSAVLDLIQALKEHEKHIFSIEKIKLSRKIKMKNIQFLVSFKAYGGMI